MAGNFRISIGIDIDPSRAQAGAAGARQAVQSIGEAAAAAAPAIDQVGTASEQAAAGMDRLSAATTGLQSSRPAETARSWTVALTSEAAALDTLRAKYDPLQAAMMRYKQTLSEISTAEAAGALSAERSIQARARALNTFTAASAAGAGSGARDWRLAQSIVSSQTIVPDRASDVAAYGASLDALRSKFNPIFGVITQYKAAQAEIRQAHAVGAISTDEMTAAMSRQRQEALADIAALKGRASAAATGHAASVGAFQTANIAAQFQDVAVTAAMGMSPMQIALQQGTQLASVLGTAEKPMQALVASATSLISPVSLVTIGVVGLAAAAIQLFGSWESGAEKTSRALETHSRLIGQIKEQYKGAAAGLTEALGSADGVLAAKAAANLDAVRARYQAEVEKLATSRWSGIGPNSSAGAPAMLVPDLRDPVISFLNSDRGPEKLRELEQAIAKVRLSTDAQAGVKKFADGLLEALKSASELAAVLPQAARAIDAASAAAERFAQNQKLALAGLTELEAFNPDRRTAAAKIDEIYNSAIGSAENTTAVEQLTRARNAAMAELQRQLDVTRKSDELGTQAILARTVAEKAAIAAAQARLKAENDNKSPAEIDQAEKAARDQVTAQAIASARENLDAARRSSAGAGMVGSAAEVAQIKARYADLIRDAGGAAEAVDKLRQAEALEIATAGTRSVSGPMRDMRLDAEEAERSVVAAQRSFGQSAGKVAAINAEMRLYNEFIRDGISITPQLAREISGYADRIGVATGKLDELNKAQSDGIARADGFRSAFSGGLSDVLKGDWKSAGNRFTSWAQQSSIDSLTQGLFGRQGEAGGGLFGDLLGGLLGTGAGGRGSSPANPMWVQSVGLGGVGGSSGGGILGSIGSWVAGLFGGGSTTTAASSTTAVGYAGGGWTGPGSRYMPKGVVHAEEVVWSRDDVSRAGGVSVVEAMRLGYRGYAAGGVVDNVVRYPTGATRRGDGGSGGVNVQIHNYAGVQVEQQESQDPVGGRTIAFTLSDQVGSAITKRGGGADQSMRQTYGLRRQKVPR